MSKGLGMCLCHYISSHRCKYKSGGRISFRAEAGFRHRLGVVICR